MYTTLKKMSATDMTCNEFGYAMVGTDSAISSLENEITFSNYNAFSNALKDYLAAMETNRLTVEYTANINALKADLLNKWSAMLLYLKAKANGLGSNQVKQAAATALATIGQYGNPKKGTTESTNNIINVSISALLAIDEEILTKTELKEWLEALTKANKEFLAAIKEREKFKTSIIRGSVRKSRYYLQKIYTALCNEIDNMSLYNPNEKVDMLIKNLNEMAIATNAKIAARKTSARNKNNQIS